MVQILCDRCEQRFARSVDHTKIIRRDFVDEPQPLKTEYLCGRCMRDYEEDFLEDIHREDDRQRRRR